MDFLATITALENEDGKKIFEVMVNDTISLCVRVLIFALIFYIGKKTDQCYFNLCRYDVKGQI